MDGSVGAGVSPGGTAHFRHMKPSRPFHRDASQVAEVEGETDMTVTHSRHALPSHERYAAVTDDVTDGRCHGWQPFLLGCLQ